MVWACHTPWQPLHKHPSRHPGCSGGQKKCWIDIVKEWLSQPMPELLRIASHRKGRKSICAEVNLLQVPQWSSGLRSWIELHWTWTRHGAVQFSSVPWPVSSWGRHERRFSRDPYPFSVFCRRSPGAVLAWIRMSDVGELPMHQMILVNYMLLE